jgi:integrase/recombinase XerD
MNAARPNALGLGLSQFFHEYLPALRGLSPRTIEGYRDSLVLLLQFLTARQHKRADRLGLEDFTADPVSDFLLYLETDRHNSIGTRNTRLAALHTFARFLASHHPEQMAALQAILRIPSKRGRSNPPIEYLEEREIKALLASIDRATPAGRRD